jgi:hypothetical protein
MPMYSAWDNFPTKVRTSRCKTKADTNFNGEAGLPHSEICGSKFAHNSPQLIAACHVLHRLCMPRHPPNALTSRLRVHTANARAEPADTARPARSRMLVARSAARQKRRRSGYKSQPLSQTPRSQHTDHSVHANRCAAHSRHRFQNPFTMSKNARSPQAPR